MLIRLNKASANQAFYVRMISTAEPSSNHFGALSAFGSVKTDLQHQLPLEELQLLPEGNSCSSCCDGEIVGHANNKQPHRLV